VDALRSLCSRGKRRVLTVAMTGSGKTVIFTRGVLAPALSRGRRGLVLVHRKELLEQTADKLTACGVPAVSIIRADDPRYDPECPVHVAMIETLLARGLWPGADVVVADECHHYTGNSWAAFRDHYQSAIVLGFTATPATASGGVLEGWDALVVATTYRQLIAAGHLVPLEVFVPTGLKKRMRGAIAMDPADAYTTYSRGRPGIIFAASVAEADACAAELCVRGVRAVSVVGERPGERDAGIAAFRAGSVDVLTSVGCLTEGFDAPRAKVAVVARGCVNVATLIQIAGRVLRPDGSDRATLVDCAGATIEHGHPCADREYSIAPGSTPISAHSMLRALWQCGSCGWIGTQRPSGPCPFCGADVPARPGLELKPRAFARMVAWTCHECGQEHYCTPLTCSQCGAETPRLARAGRDTDEQRVEYLAGQLAMCAAKGWNPFAARHRYAAKYGSAPSQAEWSAARAQVTHAP